ncbi:MAG: crossover junction endodeoxyribonuclease RuvC [Oscillospiraceae bacterium]|jgi:crossover junction endodeoxyribonuclease RuvC|nr:crossover junction endodeoxyribonuclease RuvC [Oscillospiraceae bacterium]
MLILGIDPGYATVGYGVIEFDKPHLEAKDFGAIITDPKTDFCARLEDIYDSLSQLFLKYKVSAVSIENLYFQNNQKTAIKVSHARGVMILAAAKARVPIFEYTPLQVKTSVTGTAKAPKLQVMQVVKKILNLKFCPDLDDTADALALAICHIYNPKIKFDELFKYS